MSEHDEMSGIPDIHEESYAAIRKSISVHNALYEHLSGEVRDLLPESHAQDIEDALNMTCVAFNNPPLETFLLIHEFLRNVTSITSRRNGG